jgi:hypothetical protein
MNLFQVLVSAKVSGQWDARQYMAGEVTSIALLD